MRSIQEISLELRNEMRKKLQAEQEISVLTAELLSALCPTNQGPEA